MAPVGTRKRSARADDIVTKLEAAIAKVEADLAEARAAGDERESVSWRRTWPTGSPSSTWPAASPPTTPDLPRRAVVTAHQ